jgi:hypothetical protein
MHRCAVFVMMLCGMANVTLITGPAAAQSDSPMGVVRVALRAHTIEALPLVVALSAGVDTELGLRPEFVDVGSANPVTVLSADVQAAVGTSIDQLAADRPDVVDAFNFFTRAPAAVVVRTPTVGRSLGGLVIAAPVGEDLVAQLARSLAAEPDSPRLVPGSDWFGLLSNYPTGQVDGVLSMAPLPQYLAAHLGTVEWDGSDDADSPPVGAGSLLLSREIEGPTRDRLVVLVLRGTQLLAAMPDEEVVDLVADYYPVWEPDAVLEAVRVAKRCLNPTGQLSPAALQRAAELSRLGSPG